MEKVGNGSAMRRAPGQFFRERKQEKKKETWPTARPDQHRVDQKLALRSTLASTKLTESEVDKSHTVCKLYHMKIKSRWIVIVAH